MHWQLAERKRPSLLIDDLGNIWDRFSLELKRNLGFEAPDTEFSNYVVVNLGFVEIRPFDRGSEVRLRPSKVSQRALVNLLFWLGDRKPGTVVLSTFDEGWRHELLSNQRVLLEILNRCADSSKKPAESFLLRPRVPSRTKFGRLISDLRAALQDANNIEELRSRCRSFVGTRYTFFRIPPAGSRLVFGEVGEGYRNVDASWRKIARGLPLEDIGDHHFGRWLAEAHHKVLAANEPIVDDVDAFVDWPRRGRVRTRYQRLILPFNSHDRSRWVLSTSTLRNDIDLRAKIGHEPPQVG